VKEKRLILAELLAIVQTIILKTYTFHRTRNLVCWFAGLPMVLVNSKLNGIFAQHRICQAKDIEVVIREVKTVLQARLELAASRQMTSRLTGALFLVKRRACNRLRLSQRVETE
jgi:hypothetical protein